MTSPSALHSALVDHRVPSIHTSEPTSPHPFFHPTIAKLSTKPPSPASNSSNLEAKHDHPEYNSRKARKGRYALRSHHVHHHGEEQDEEAGLGRHKSFTSVGRVPTHESHFKPNLNVDVSFWIAVIFTLGSVVWVVNGFLVLLPLYIESIEENFSTIYFTTAAATAFVGGTLFEVGSYLMVVEALNRGRENDFGPSLYSLIRSASFSSSGGKELDPQTTRRDSSSERTVTGQSPSQSQGKGAVMTDKENQKQAAEGDIQRKKDQEFVWWGKPMWHDIGYVAAYVQLWAATIFWISTLTGLPGVISGYPTDVYSQGVLDAFFWTPQVVGGTGFVISSGLLMLEVQKKWYKPALGDIGWHVGLWNLIGAVGFLLCGAFGYSLSTWAINLSGICTFFGSPAFLIGSIMQSYEVIWREPEPKKDK